MGATHRPTPPSRQSWKPGLRFRYLCSLSRTKSSKSIPARAPTPSASKSRLFHAPTSTASPARAQPSRPRATVVFRWWGFLEVETPALVTSPGLDLHLDAFEVPGPSGPRYL